jgi:hypothetical protein
MMAAMDKPVTTLYGIRNCDTVKRARSWLDEHQHAYTFHDFKLQGVPTPALDHWLAGRGLGNTAQPQRHRPGASSTMPRKPPSPTPPRRVP